MKPKLLIQLAAACILFFALGHSIGHFTRYDVKDLKAQQLQKMMIDNKFDMFGQMRSYDENYNGMSLNLIITLIAFAIILFIISNIDQGNKNLVIKLIYPILICILGFSITSFLFFFTLPAITCLIASILLGLAIYSFQKNNTL